VSDRDGEREREREREQVEHKVGESNLADGFVGPKGVPALLQSEHELYPALLPSTGPLAQVSPQEPVHSNLHHAQSHQHRTHMLRARKQHTTLVTFFEGGTGSLALSVHFGGGTLHTERLVMCGADQTNTHFSSD
jgi:hypothetical protein